MHEAQPPPFETPSPPVSPILCRWMDLRPQGYGWRPRGTRDWLFLYTERGRGRIRHSGGETFTEPGDAIIIQPGAPHDYAMARTGSGRLWRNWWAHFLPRESWHAWMQWPEIGRGHYLMQVPASLRAQARREFTQAEHFARGMLPAGKELALNALERILLLCDAANPRRKENQRDPRVRKAVEFISQHFAEKLTVAGIARFAGLSRSRLCDLFETQVGYSVMAMVEEIRLNRAREFLEHTASSLAEIADQSGFSSPFYLSLRFKKRFGVAPSSYRALVER